MSGVRVQRTNTAVGLGVPWAVVRLLCLHDSTGSRHCQGVFYEFHTLLHSIQNRDLQGLGLLCNLLHWAGLKEIGLSGSLWLSVGRSVWVRSVYGSGRFVALAGSQELTGLHGAGSHAHTRTREDRGQAVRLSVALWAVWMLAGSLGLAGWLALAGCGALWSSGGCWLAVVWAGSVGSCGAGSGLGARQGLKSTIMHGQDFSVRVVHSHRTTSHTSPLCTHAKKTHQCIVLVSPVGMFTYG